MTNTGKKYEISATRKKYQKHQKEGDRDFLAYTVTFLEFPDIKVLVSPRSFDRRRDVLDAYDWLTGAHIAKVVHLKYTPIPFDELLDKVQKLIKNGLGNETYKQAQVRLCGEREQLGKSTYAPHYYKEQKAKGKGK